MLIGLFKSNQKLINALTLILTIVLWLPAFFIDLNIDFSHLITTNIFWLDMVIAIILIVGQSSYLNIIVSEYKLVKENSHLTSLMFVLFNSCCVLFLNLNQVVIANTFVLVAFHQLLRMYNSKNNYAISFNAAFLIAIASLIYLPSIIYIALLWITLIYTTAPKWRDFIISLIGFSIPLIYFIVYKFIFGDLSIEGFSDSLINIFNMQWGDFSLYLKVFFIIFIIISLLSFMQLLSTISRSVVRVRKMLIVVLLMFIIAITSMFWNKFDYLSTFIMVSIPLSIIVANFFQNLKKRWLAEFLFLCLLGGVVLSYFS